MNKIQAAVIGLGNIGLGYDFESTNDRLVLTHCSAFHYHPAFELVAAVDEDARRRQAFENKFSTKAFASIEELPAVDVVAVATPTNTHLQVFRALASRLPKVFLCEKPLADSVENAKEIIGVAGDSSVCVNYMRRFEPGLLKLKETLPELGDIYKGVVFYGKGFAHNASHYVDLLQFLLGSIEDWSVLNTEYPAEPEVRIRFSTTDVYFLRAREECFSLLEFELLGTKGRIRYGSAGSEISIQRSIPDTNCPGYTILDPSPKPIANDFQRYQWHVVDHIANHLKNGTDLNSNAQTALQTLEQIEAILGS